MAELEQQRQSLLSSPELLNQLFSMAGSLNQPRQTPPAPQETAMPFDPAALSKLMELMRRTRLEPRQQQLLQALGAYLPGDRVRKLEKAMQAARIAKFAASLPAPPNGGR